MMNALSISILLSLWAWFTVNKQTLVECGVLGLIHWMNEDCYQPSRLLVIRILTDLVARAWILHPLLACLVDTHWLVVDLAANFAIDYVCPDKRLPVSVRWGFLARRVVNGDGSEGHPWHVRQVGGEEFGDRVALRKRRADQDTS